MQPGTKQWDEKDLEHLIPNRFSDLAVAHPHVTQDVEALLIVVALGDLLIVHDHDRCTQKRKAQKNPQKEQTAVQIRESFHRAAFGAEVHIHRSVDRLIALVGADCGVRFILHL